MNYTDAKDGLHVRFAHHDGKGRNNPPKPVFRLRPHLSYIHDPSPASIGPRTIEDGWDRVVVVPFPPYRRGDVLPFTPDNADAFVPAAIPLASVPARSQRQDRSGSRRRAK